MSACCRGYGAATGQKGRARYVPNLTVTWRGGRWLLGTVPCMRVMCVGGHVPTSRFSLGSKYLASTRQVFSGSNKRGRSAVVPTHPPGDSLFICRPIQKLIQQAEACQALFCPALGPALSCPVLPFCYDYHVMYPWVDEMLGC